MVKTFKVFNLVEKELRAKKILRKYDNRNWTK